MAECLLEVEGAGGDAAAAHLGTCAAGEEVAVAAAMAGTCAAMGSLAAAMAMPGYAAAAARPRVCSLRLDSESFMFWHCSQCCGRP